MPDYRLLCATRRIVTMPCETCQDEREHVITLVAAPEPRLMATCDLCDRRRVAIRMHNRNVAASNEYIRSLFAEGHQ